MYDLPWAASLHRPNFWATQRKTPRTLTRTVQPLPYQKVNNASLFQSPRSAITRKGIPRFALISPCSSDFVPIYVSCFREKLRFLPIWLRFLPICSDLLQSKSEKIRETPLCRPFLQVPHLDPQQLFASHERSKCLSPMPRTYVATDEAATLPQRLSRTPSLEEAHHECHTTTHFSKGSCIRTTVNRERKSSPKFSCIKSF